MWILFYWIARYYTQKEMLILSFHVAIIFYYEFIYVLPHFK